MCNKMSSTAKFEEKEMVTEKSSAAKYGEKNENISEYIMKSFLEKGNFVKIDDNNFLSFEKNEDYWNMVYLEKVLSVLFEIIKIEREEKENKVYGCLEAITEIIKNVNEKIMLLSFYDENKNKNVCEIKFPYLWYMKKFRSLNEYDNILDYFNKWEDLDKMQDSLASEENNVISQGDKYSGYQQDEYGNVYIERLREIGYEMEVLSLERKRRYERLRDKFFDVNRKIKKIYIYQKIQSEDLNINSSLLLSV